MPRSLVPLETLSLRRRTDFGGKAVGLAALAREGFPVPRGFAVSTRAAEDFYRLALSPDQLPASLLDRPPATEKELTAIRTRLQTFPIPEMLRKQLQETRRLLLEGKCTAVAVRSSSTAEDDAAHSAAGLHHTVLGVRTEAELDDAVRTVWASLFTQQAFGYLRKQGVTDPPAVGLVLQELVSADVAGVLFTANPLTGDGGELVIDASPGLGQSVVAGMVSPDTFRVDKDTGALRERIAGQKDSGLFFNEGNLQRQPLPEEAQSTPCLSDAQVDALAGFGLQIEEALGKPQDIEWAHAEGRFYILQARPITTAIHGSHRRRKRRSQSPSGRRNIVWSNVNVGEALPGVATPLTWSILSSFSELGFRRAFGSLGCSVPSDAELVGNFRGRIYLNLTEFMGILTQIPGLRPSTLIALGGGGHADELDASVEGRSPARFLARLPWTLTRLARENLSLGERVDAFEQSFAADKQRMGGIDPRVLPAASMARMMTDAARMLEESGAIMLTAYGNLLGCVVLLGTLLRVFGGDRSQALARQLVSGLSDLDSAAPGVALWHIAAIAREETAVREAILGGQLHSVDQLPEGPTRRAMQNFLEAYGHRGPREAELIEPRWREDASVLFSTLRLHLEGAPIESPLAREQRLRSRRQEAETAMNRIIPVPLQPLAKRLLHLTRRFMRLRERLRGHVTHVLGEYRRIALDASRRIAAYEPEAGTDAAFFLTESELRQTLVTRHSVSARVGQRRRRYERDRGLADPPSSFVGYPPTLDQREGAQGDEVRGLAASAGVVRGVARIIEGSEDIRAFQGGEILVCSTADVGLAPLFLAASAVVTELGGPLSHAAIVLREYGTPSVVNAAGITRWIQTGDEIEVDGNTGVVRRLSQTASNAL